MKIKDIDWCKEAFDVTCKRYFNIEDQDLIERAFVFYMAAISTDFIMEEDNIKWAEESIRQYEMQS